MKKLIALPLLLLAAVLATAQPAPENDGSDGLMQTEQQLWTAYVRHDAATLETLLAADFTFTKENGYVSTRTTELKTQTALKKKRPADATAPTDNYHVQAIRLFDRTTAVTNGYYEEKDTDGKLYRLQFTNTWIKNADRWQLVAIQISIVSDAVLKKLAEKK